MSQLHVIAVEKAFLISYLPTEPVTACVYKDGSTFLYTGKGELIGPYDYKRHVGVIENAVNEGKYDWTDFYINEGQVLAKDSDENILVDNRVVEPFSKLPMKGKGTISSITLKLFNEFLQANNKNNKDMLEALRLSLKDGFFLQEVEEIIRDDAMKNLNDLDKKTIVRCKIEKTDFITSYVKKLINSKDCHKYIDINYFFRRLFNLEKNQYLCFEGVWRVQ